MKTFPAAVIALSIFSNTSANECPVSTPNLTDPEGAIKSSESYDWYGSNKLAAMIPYDGIWRGMGPIHNYRNKFWWWQEGYTAGSGAAEQLKITATNPEQGIEVQVDAVNNAFTGSDNYKWNSMITALEFPSAGCWKIVGQLGEESLELHVLVGEQ